MTLKRSYYLKLASFLIAALFLLSACVELELSNNSLDTSNSSGELSSSQAEDTSKPSEISEISEISEADNSVPDESELDSQNSFEAEINGQYAIVFDETNDRVLYTKNADAKCYPASLTKLMTAIVALENLPEDEVFTVGSELGLVQKGSSLAMLARGQKLTLRMLIEGLLIPSGNDAAYVIAVGTYRKIKNDSSISDEEAVAGFCNMMNEKAAEIGANNTHYVNPDGWHNDDHYTTTRDVLTISRYAMTKPLIAEVVATSKVREIFVSGEIAVWNNSNKLLHEPEDLNEFEYYNEYAKGLKTGSTPEAGYCLAAYAEFGDSKIYAVVMDCSQSNKRFEDANKLLDLAFSVD